MINELDNLKKAWKTISEAESKKEYTADDLKKIVKKKSNNELAKIRRKLICEWSITLAISAFLVLFIRFNNPPDTKYALLFIGIILIISFYPYVKVIRLKYSDHPNLKNYLQEYISSFNKLVKQYMRMATILIPVAGLGGFLLGYHSAASLHEWEGFFKLNNIILLTLLVAGVSFAGYWVQQHYFKWIYGKNIQRLRNCLSDLDEVEDKN